MFVHLKLKLKVKINAHGKKELEPNQNDAPGHFLSAKCLHTRPTFGSNDRFLLLKPSHPSHTYLFKSLKPTSVLAT